MKETQTVDVEGEVIKANKDCIMTLGLGYKILLIIERLIGKSIDFWFTSSKLKNSNLKRESKSEFGQRYKIENEKYESNDEEAKYISNGEQTPIINNQFVQWTIRQIDNQFDKKLLSSYHNFKKFEWNKKKQVIKNIEFDY